VDTVKDLGDFVELEATVPHGDFEQTKKYLMDFAHELGLTLRQVDNRGYPYHLLRR
jgi:adenylate cyclase class IV